MHNMIDPTLGIRYADPQHAEVGDLVLCHGAYERVYRVDVFAPGQADRPTEAPIKPDYYLVRVMAESASRYYGTKDAREAYARTGYVVNLDKSSNYFTGGKYDSARDEILDRMAADGWANESDGDVESSAGWFARVCNTEDELAEIFGAFGEDIARLGLPLASLVGDFLIEHDERGAVRVTRYDTHGECAHEYAVLASIYQEWVESQDGPEPVEG